MPRYCQISDVTDGMSEAVLIQLSNDDPEATTTDESLIDRIIGDVEDLIDDNLRGRYTLPLAEVPTSVRRIAIALARHDLYARRPQTGVPDDVTRIRKEELKNLEAIRNRVLSLGDHLQVPQPDTTSIKARTPSRFFDDNKQSAY